MAALKDAKELVADARARIENDKKYAAGKMPASRKMTEINPCDWKVAIIVVTWNAPEFVRLCLDSVRHYTTVPHEIIVVDNGSEAPLREWLTRQPDLKLVLNNENKLWCEGCNQGIQAAEGEVTHLMLLNSDMEVRRADWLQRMLNVLESSPRVGMVGTAADRVRIWPTFGSPDGQCLLIKKRLLDEIGLLNSEKFPWNGADIDLAARAFARGFIYKIMPPKPELVVHYHGMSRRQRSQTTPAPRLQRELDFHRIFRDAGLRPVYFPRPLWQIYKNLCQPFFDLTRRESKLAAKSMWDEK